MITRKKMKDIQKAFVLVVYFVFGIIRKDSIRGNILPPRKFILPDPDLYEVIVRRLTRSQDGKCDCKICDIGRLNGPYWNKFVSEMKKERSKSTEVGIPKYGRLCKKCFFPIYRGSDHTESMCKSKRQVVKNLEEAVSLSNTSADIMTSNHLKGLVSENGSRELRIPSSTGGKPLNIQIGVQSSSLKALSHQQLKLMQKEANLSDNQIHKITKNLRLHLGRTVIEPRLKDSMTLSKRIFDSFFNADVFHF